MFDLLPGSGFDGDAGALALGAAEELDFAGDVDALDARRGGAVFDVRGQLGDAAAVFQKRRFAV